ncbi:MAG: hypothetical protein AAF907_09020, partial [Planctomycetota bacterium]
MLDSALRSPSLWTVIAACCLAAATPAVAQDTTSLKTKVENLQTEYVRGAIELAVEYEKAGDPASAIELLENVAKVLPDAPGLQQKLDQLQDDVLSADQTSLTIDAPMEWTAVAEVREGAAFRLAASGSY